MLKAFLICSASPISGQNPMNKPIIHFQQIKGTKANPREMEG